MLVEPRELSRQGSRTKVYRCRLRRDRWVRSIHRSETAPPAISGPHAEAIGTRFSTSRNRPDKRVAREVLGRQMSERSKQLALAVLAAVENKEPIELENLPASPFRFPPFQPPAPNPGRLRPKERSQPHDNPGGARQRDSREFGPEVERRRGDRVNSSGRARHRRTDLCGLDTVASPCESRG